MKYLYPFLLVIYYTIAFAQPAVTFTSPDTVCVGQSISIQNNTTGQLTNLWNFCKQVPSSQITGVNIGNPGLATRPANIQVYKDGVNYIGFVSNEQTFGSGVRRLNFGTNPLNPTPTVTTLSTFSGQLDGPKGMKFLYEGGNWYGFFVADNWTAGFNYILVRLDFGNSLMNTPTITNFGTLGGVMNEYLTDLDIVKTTSQGFIGFVSTTSGKLFRLNFGNNIISTPTAVNLGVLGAAKPTYSFNLFQRNGNWYIFMPKDDVTPANCSLVNLSFGSSLLNTPTVTNYGNPGNLLNRAYDFLPFVDCESLKGYVLAPGASKIVEYTFPNDINSTTLLGNSIGNIASFNFPADFSNVVLYNNEKYVFVTNQSSNTISRLKLSSNCNSFGITSSTQIDPPIFKIDSAGTYNISLVVDENLNTESRTCKEIVVIDTIKKPDARVNTVTCSTDSIRLNVLNIDTLANYSWSGPNGFSSTKPTIAIKLIGSVQTGQYIVTATGRCGVKKDTVVLNAPTNFTVNIGRDTSICQGNSLTLNATTAGATYQWSTGAGTPTITVNQAGTYWVRVTAGGCSATDTLQLSITTPPGVFNLGDDTTYCGSFSRILRTGVAGTLWSTGTTGAQITVTQAGTYIASISNSCGIQTDSVKILQEEIPLVAIEHDTVICNGSTIVLIANTPASGFIWSTGDTSKSITINKADIYWVEASEGFCTAVDTAYVEECEGDLWVPNAFTPNNDQINDWFKVYGKNILEYRIMIFNRWGEKLYESDDINNSWDGYYKGQVVQLDTYVWLINYKVNSKGKVEEKLKKGILLVLK